MSSSCGDTPPPASATAVGEGSSLPATSEAEREADKQQLGHLLSKLALETPQAEEKVEDASEETTPRLSLPEGHVSYSPETLRSLDFSTGWPDFLDESFKNGRNRWDPDRWHQNTRNGATAGERTKGGDPEQRPHSSLSIEGKVTHYF